MTIVRYIIYIPVGGSTILLTITNNDFNCTPKWGTAIISNDDMCCFPESMIN